jgi:hypothetical protein
MKNQKSRIKNEETTEWKPIIEAWLVCFGFKEDENKARFTRSGDKTPSASRYLSGEESHTKPKAFGQKFRDGGRSKKEVAF